MVQQFLLQFTGALNRRRAYAATHPMVVSAEQRLLECAEAVLADRDAFTLGVGKTELLIDGEPYVTKRIYARELAMRLHRRSVGAITFVRGVQLMQISEALAWLAADWDFLPFAPTRAGGIEITTIGYDHLVLDDSLASAESTVSTLWRALAALAESGDLPPRLIGGRGADVELGRGGIQWGVVELAIDAEVEQAIDEAAALGNAVYVDGALTGVDSEQVLTALRGSMNNPLVVRRTAMALAELASAARDCPVEARTVIGEQLHGLLQQLGEGSFAQIINSLADRSMRTAFIADVAYALPVSAALNWIEHAAAATGQQMSHQILRLMTKMSTLADTSPVPAVQQGFHDAARDLVRAWDLPDPNPTEHVVLLDSIARFERSGASATEAVTALGTSMVETSRIVQMALELDFAGQDTVAAADALIISGAGPTLIEWTGIAGQTGTSQWLYRVATSEKAVRRLLLTEPVDRLQARAMLQLLDASSTNVLLDVLERAEARGTRMIVRQRLAEFGSGITPLLWARLEKAPWFLVRNILTLLQEMSGDAASAPGESLFRLLEHPQVQVRTEALRVLILSDTTRDTALRTALRDANERIVVLAIQSIAELAEAGTRPSRAITAQLMAMVDAGNQSDPVRARAVRAVGTVRSDEIREWLLGLVTRRSPVLRRLKLVEPTQTAAAALQLLQRTYAGDPAMKPVRALLERTSSDARWQVRDVTSERSP